MLCNLNTSKTTRMNHFSHFSSIPFLKKIYFEVLLARRQLLQPEPLVWSPPPSIILSNLLTSLVNPPVPLSASVGGACVTQSDATLNSVYHPPPATSCTARYRECHMRTPHHTNMHTVSLAHRPRITFVKASAPLLPHRRAQYEWDKEMRTTMIKTENSPSGCQCWGKIWGRANKGSL